MTKLHKYQFNLLTSTEPTTLLGRWYARCICLIDEINPYRLPPAATQPSKIDLNFRALTRKEGKQNKTQKIKNPDPGRDSWGMVTRSIISENLAHPLPRRKTHSWRWISHLRRRERSSRLSGQWRATCCLFNLRAEDPRVRQLQEEDGETLGSGRTGLSFLALVPLRLLRVSTWLRTAYVIRTF